jgi:hypothetical protein
MLHAAEPEANVASPTLTIAGKSQEQWSEEWWKWAASFEDDDSPIVDRTGDLCASGQQGAVWFLAGVYGSAPVKRECTIPADKWIFFPIVNYVVASAGGCAAAVETAREYTDDPEELTLIIDGERIQHVEQHRFPTPCFSLDDDEESGEAFVAANGYFIMLKPLSAGHHTIKWGGILKTLRQAVVYDLVVAPRLRDVTL